MATREELAAEFGGEKLDEFVHDAKSQEASDINNGGIDAQIDYLLENGWTLEGILAALRNMEKTNGGE
jgi:hypothetical protein